MTVYEPNWTTYYPVESPLNEEFDFFEPPLIIEPYELPPDLVQQLMFILVAFVVVSVGLFGAFVVTRWSLNHEVIPQTTAAIGLVASEEVVLSSGLISPIFSREVQYWEDEIVQWADDHNLDPNMAATIMQIESCGDPQAASHAGAQGLFQVMPYHFEAGESTLDPDTNARRGLGYYAEQLGYFGDINLAFAAYNGGPGNASKAYNLWPHETQRYYYWSEGIYADALAGKLTSLRLQEWMSAGGASLCNQAASRLGLQ
jgi:hypothetical protein